VYLHTLIHQINCGTHTNCKLGYVLRVTLVNNAAEMQPSNENAKQSRPSTKENKQQCCKFVFTGFIVDGRNTFYGLKKYTNGPYI
jgi:hypothetical protein